MVCILTREYDTGKQRGRRGRTGGLPNWIIELPLCRFTLSCAAFFWGGRGVDEGGNNWNSETFLWNSLPTTLLLTTQVACCQLFLSKSLLLVTFAFPLLEHYQVWDAHFGDNFSPAGVGLWRTTTFSLKMCTSSARSLASKCCIADLFHYFNVNVDRRGSITFS